MMSASQPTIANLNQRLALWHCKWAEQCLLCAHKQAGITESYLKGPLVNSLGCFLPTSLKVHAAGLCAKDFHMYTLWSKTTK